ncbi:hypothetical protein [Halopenitus persicus]|uniref:Uncharacterized protein n=1 Tax=Halopenitus persicus TaxID=1048396 RepID=A0A1H3NJG5_9EURY|nr:hypothetical protein [Halopenitus persicus]SDY88968.1 hypothetical protein SAMN05216564_11323 [Halopenitus persicus]
MDWTTTVALAVFAGGCALAVYQSRKDDWPISRKVGTIIAMIGAAIALFVSQVVSIDLSPFSLEVVGTLIMLGGFLSIIFWDSDQEV